MKDRRWKHGLLFLLIAALAANALACNGRRPQETEMTSMTRFNETRFGDAQGRSYLPVTGRLGTDVVWTHASPDTKRPAPPRHVAIRDDELVVQYPRSLELRNRSTGEVVWSKRTTPSFEFQMTDDGLATMDAYGDYTLFGFDGRELLTESLPLLAEDAHLYRCWSADGEFRYAFGKAAIPASDPDEPDIPSGAAYHRFDSKKNAFRWRFELDDTLLQVLVDEAGTRWSLVTAHGIHSFAPDAGDSAQVATYDADLIEAAAYDFDDHLLVLLRDKGQRLLRRIDPSGGLDWELPAPDGAITQPPASAPGGHAYLLAGTRLLHIRAGQPIWTYDIPFADGHRPQFTVLSDRTVLLTAGTHCIQLRQDGEEMVRLDTGSTLAGRPIMDPAGRVYLGAKSWIRCYH